jgi:hypothetical protein
MMRIGVGKYGKVGTKNRLDFSHHCLSHLRHSHPDLGHHWIKEVVFIRGRLDG